MAAALVLLVSWTLIVTAQSTAKPHDFLLSSGKAGRIELGMSVDQVYKVFGRDHVRLVDLFKEGLFSPGLNITLPGSATDPAIVADIREWPCGEFSVWGIDVRDPRFHTTDGVHVGSTGADLRRHYEFVVSEEEGIAAIVTSLQMSFSLDRPKPVDSARVTAVWIWPDPDAVRKRRCPGRG